MEPQAAQQGSTVRINYAIRLADGSQIGATMSKPLTFRIGGGKVLPALEEGVIGMRPSEKRAVLVTATQGYGAYNKELVLRIDRSLFPREIRLQPGRTIQYQTRNGERANFIIQEVAKDTVTIDGNHPLAGQDLTYEVELLDLS